jgi:hypothetical protein
MKVNKTNIVAPADASNTIPVSRTFFLIGLKANPQKSAMTAAAEKLNITKHFTPRRF